MRADRDGAARVALSNHSTAGASARVENDAARWHDRGAIEWCKQQAKPWCAPGQRSATQQERRHRSSNEAARWHDSWRMLLACKASNTHVDDGHGVIHHAVQDRVEEVGCVLAVRQQRAEALRRGRDGGGRRRHGACGVREQCMQPTVRVAPPSKHASNHQCK